MRIAFLAPTLLLAACASERAQQAPVSTPPPPAERPARSAHQHGHLIGMSAQDLGELFGAPFMQVREGPGLKLQWRGGGCVLDTYLYAPESGAGVERVTHVDARRESGADTEPTNCEASIESAR